MFIPLKVVFVLSVQEYYNSIYEPMIKEHSSNPITYCQVPNKRRGLLIEKSQSPFPRPMAHKAVPISVSLALGHASANAVKATAGELVHR